MQGSGEEAALAASQLRSPPALGQFRGFLEVFLKELNFEAVFCVQTSKVKLTFMCQWGLKPSERK